MSTLLKMQKFHPLCSRCIGMYPLQNRWTVLRYLQCYENFSECCTHLILPETALFSPTPTFAKEPKKPQGHSCGFRYAYFFEFKEIVRFYGFGFVYVASSENDLRFVLFLLAASFCRILFAAL